MSRSNRPQRVASRQNISLDATQNFEPCPQLTETEEFTASENDVNNSAHFATHERICPAPVFDRELRYRCNGSETLLYSGQPTVQHVLRV
jgi:hypothetical protein